MLKKTLLASFTLALFMSALTADASTTTIKIYPDDDGWTLLYDDEAQTDWSSARTYTGSFARAPQTNDIVIRSDNQALTPKFRIYRASLVFDTSIIPNNAVIQSASLNFYDKGGAGDIETVVVSHERASTTNLAKADWELSNYGTTEFARSTSTDNQYNSWEFNTSGKSYLDLDDLTILGLMTEFDFDNITPAYNQIQSEAFYSIEAPGTSTDPYIEIKYTYPHE